MAERQQEMEWHRQQQIQEQMERQRQQQQDTSRRQQQFCEVAGSLQQATMGSDLCHLNDLIHQVDNNQCIQTSCMDDHYILTTRLRDEGQLPSAEARASTLHSVANAWESLCDKDGWCNPASLSIAALEEIVSCADHCRQRAREEQVSLYELFSQQCNGGVRTSCCVNHHIRMDTLDCALNEVTDHYRALQPLRWKALGMLQTALGSKDVEVMHSVLINISGLQCYVSGKTIHANVRMLSVEPICSCLEGWMLTTQEISQFEDQMRSTLPGCNSIERLEALLSRTRLEADRVCAHSAILQQMQEQMQHCAPNSNSSYDAAHTSDFARGAAEMLSGARQNYGATASASLTLLTIFAAHADAQRQTEHRREKNRQIEWVAEQQRQFKGEEIQYQLLNRLFRDFSELAASAEIMLAQLREIRQEACSRLHVAIKGYSVEELDAAMAHANSLDLEQVGLDAELTDAKHRSDDLCAANDLRPQLVAATRDDSIPALEAVLAQEADLCKSVSCKEYALNKSNILGLHPEVYAARAHLLKLRSDWLRPALLAATEGSTIEVLSNAIASAETIAHQAEMWDVEKPLKAELSKAHNRIVDLKRAAVIAELEQASSITTLESKIRDAESVKKEADDYGVACPNGLCEAVHTAQQKIIDIQCDKTIHELKAATELVGLKAAQEETSAIGRKAQFFESYDNWGTQSLDLKNSILYKQLQVKLEESFDCTIKFRLRQGRVIPQAEWHNDTASCELCNDTYGIITRAHHCRLCGRCVCGSCSPDKIELDSEVPYGNGQNGWVFYHENNAIYMAELHGLHAYVGTNPGGREVPHGICWVTYNDQGSELSRYYGEMVLGWIGDAIGQVKDECIRLAKTGKTFASLG